MGKRHEIIPARNVQSLTWIADALVDLVAGGARYDPSGAFVPGQVCWAFPFDAAATAEGSEFAVIYTRYGTTGLLLRNGRFVRQLHRSFQHATTSEYPICLVPHEGRTLLIHCPEQHSRLEIEDAETGEVLTRRASQPDDFFHSRLEANRSGSRFLSAGWVWQPWEGVVYFSIDEALRHPEHLDSLDWSAPYSLDVSMTPEVDACWLTDTTTAVSGGDEEQDADDERYAGMLRLQPRGIVVYDTSANSVLHSVVLDELAGSIVAVDEEHVLALHRSPRLIRLTDGAVVDAWPEISSSSKEGRRWPLAFDRRTRRLAIAQEDGIHLVAC